jgi:Holliday junction DNA helicase RuvA
MIAYVKGVLTFIQEQHIVVDVGGIGYELICPNPYAFQNALDQEILIHTYMHVREDAQLLYGFRNEDEKHLFMKLISVSGIGPKGALAILSGVDVEGFITAVEQEDEKFLTSFPGVGKKTARQIILDLKGKLSDVFVIKGTEQAETQSPEIAEKLDEVAEALRALDYSDKEIRPVIGELRHDKGDTNALIKKSLALLVKK